MKNEKERYRAKEVMDLCDVTRKQLLYYEKKGFLKDVERDEENNYRYYSQLNINQLFIMKESLSMGYSLDDIYDISMRGDVATMRRCIDGRMDLAREDFFRSMAQYEQTTKKYAQFMEGILYLESYQQMQKEGISWQRCELYTWPLQKCITARNSGTPFDAQSDNQARISELYIHAREQDLKTCGPLFFQFRNLVRKDAAEIELTDREMVLGFPVLDLTGQRSDLTALGGIECASTIHVGGYDESLHETYKKLLAWCREEQLMLTGDSIELYLLGGEMMTNPDQYVTRILLPLAK